MNSATFSAWADHRVDREWQLPISGPHPIMMERSALADGGGWGVHAHPLSLYYQHVQSFCVRSIPYMYSVGRTETIPVCAPYSMVACTVQNVHTKKGENMLKNLFSSLCSTLASEFVLNFFTHLISQRAPHTN